MARIFLSHSSADNAAAIALAGWLADEGWDDYFLDLDPARGIVAGERWERALSAAAHRCQAVVFLVSPAWLRSDWCQRELQLAHKLDKHIFGVLIDEVDIASVPPKLRDHWQLVDLGGGRDHGPPIRVQLPGGGEAHVTFSRSGLQRLRAGLAKAEIDARFFAWPPKDDPNRPPWRGLRPLEAEDAGIFFGREAPIIAVLDRLRGFREAAPPRLLAILGASGAGKSSFLRAGLIPRLARDDRNYLPLPVVRPARGVISGPDGFVTALAEALRVHGVRTTRAAVDHVVAAAIAGEMAALEALLASLASAASSPPLDGEEAAPAPVLVLPIDQGEEFFQSEGRGEAAAFLALLARLLMLAAPSLAVLVTIRSDSYERFQVAPELEGITQSAFSLPPLPRGAYQTVIEGPAARLRDSTRELRIEPALTAELLRELAEGGGRDALPLLAFTLERLYDSYGGDGDLTLAEYRAMGGIGGSIDAAVARALERAGADPAVPADHEARLALLRRAMIPWLAGIDSETGRPRRQVARLSEIPHEARPLLRHLVAERLLSTGQDFSVGGGTDGERLVKAGEATIEPAHEALLRQWRLLGDWLKEDHVWLALLEGVQRASRDWEANGRDAAWLTHRAGRLEDAERLSARPDLAARLDAADRDYLAACRAAEADRRNRALEEARKLAEAERRVAARTRAGALAAILLAAVAAGFGWYGLTQSWIAVERSQEAERQRGEAVRQSELASLREQEARAAATQASEQREIAEAAARRAEAELRQAQINEARYLMPKAIEAAMRGSFDLALGLALFALPESLDADPPSRPVVPDALSALAEIHHLDRRLAVAYGHQGAINRGEFSADGRFAVTASQDQTARLWDLATGAELASLTGHEAALTAAEFSPDGRRVVTASYDGTARLWSVDTPQDGRILGHHDAAVGAARFSPDGASVATASADATVALWRVADGRRLWRTEPLPDQAQAWDVLFLPDGERLAIAASGHRIVLIDTADGREVTDFQLGPHWLRSMALSPDGSRIAATRWGGAFVWDVASGQLVATLEGHQGDVTAARFSPDGTRLLTAGQDGTARLWDIGTGNVIFVYAHQSAVVDLDFSPDGARVASASMDRTARIWEVAQGYAQSVPLSHDSGVTGVRFSHDGGRLLTVSHDSALRLWSVADKPRIVHPPTAASGAAPTFLAFDHGRVVMGSPNARVMIREVESGAVGPELVGHFGAVATAAFSRDGTRIVTGADDNMAAIWDIADGTLIHVLHGHTAPVKGVAFSPDGAFVATASHDGTARLWDAASGAMLRELSGHQTWVGGVGFAPDGRAVVTVSADQTARIWSVPDGVSLATLEPHYGWVNSVHHSSDGARLVTVSNEHVARLWSAAGRLVATLEGHREQVGWALFSPDGERLVTVSADQARLWNGRTGESLGVLGGHRGAVGHAAFSADGAYVLTVSSDYAARLWDARTGTLRTLWPGHPGPVIYGGFLPDSTVVTVASDASIRIWDMPLEPEVLVPFAQAAQFRPLGDAERRDLDIARPPAIDPIVLAALDPCDRLAANPFDPQRVAPGVVLEKIEAEEAVAACEAAVAARPDEPRLLYQLGRALEAALRREEAAAAHRAAADRGYAMAFSNLAHLYRHGLGVEKDTEHGLALLREALDRGATAAAATLGEMLRNGEGAAPDFRAALAIWRDAAAKGDPSSHWSLAIVAERGSETGTPDLVAALHHYTVAIRRLEAMEAEDHARWLRYRRGSLARLLDPATVVATWKAAIVEADNLLR